MVGMRYTRHRSSHHLRIARYLRGNHHMEMELTVIGQLIAAGIASLFLLLLWHILNSTGRTILIIVALLCIIAYAVSFT